MKLTESKAWKEVCQIVKNVDVSEMPRCFDLHGVLFDDKFVKSMIGHKDKILQNKRLEYFGSKYDCNYNTARICDDCEVGIATTSLVNHHDFIQPKKGYMSKTVKEVCKTCARSYPTLVIHCNKDEEGQYTCTSS